MPSLLLVVFHCQGSSLVPSFLLQCYGVISKLHLIICQSIIEGQSWNVVELTY